MKVVEFYGLPGVGKTTTANLLINLYLEKGYRVPSIKQLQNFKSFKRLHLLTLPKILLFSLFCLIKFKTLIDLMMLSKNQGFSFKKRVHRSVILLKTLFTVQRFKKYDLLILDEGIKQNLWSLFLNSQIKKIDEIIVLEQKQLVKLETHFLIVLETSLKTVIDRIQSRIKTSKQTRFNYMSSKELKVTLEKNLINYETLKNLSKNHLIINAKKNPEENAIYIFNELVL